MARGAGIALKSLSWVLRAIEFGAAGVILALFSYFLAKLSINHLAIPNQLKAVEGISGAAVLYTILAVLLVCCLGGLGFFALIAFVIDIAFVGAFIYVAYETRGGAHSCNGFVNTPVGSGQVGTDLPGTLPSLRTACRMNTACFAVAIVAAVFFLLSAFIEIALWRHHKSEKKYGPGPANNYTTGSGNRKFWQRKNRNATLASGGLAAEKHNPDALPTHTTPSDVRHSYNTEATAVGPEPVIYNKYAKATQPGFGDNLGTTAHTGHNGYGETVGLNAYGETVGHQTTGVTHATEMPTSRY